jgi:hypothetical protein
MQSLKLFIMPVKTLTRKKVSRKKVRKETTADSYNEFKQFGKKQYTGMQVGRSHKWYYDKGEWKETKITPDLWRLSYDVTKRRAGRAPQGSGVPTGTAYHWYILAHQQVKKLNANDYSTSMTGLKYKLAHKRADKEKWSTKTPTQRKHLIGFLKDMIHQLESEVVPLEFELNDKLFKGEAVPLPETCEDGMCHQLDITLNDENLGVIRRLKNGWKMDKSSDKKLIEAIGEQITQHYQ